MTAPRATSCGCLCLGLPQADPAHPNLPGQAAPAPEAHQVFPPGTCAHPPGLRLLILGDSASKSAPPWRPSPVTPSAVPGSSLLAPSPLDGSASLLLTCPPDWCAPSPPPGPAEWVQFKAECTAGCFPRSAPAGGPGPDGAPTALQHAGPGLREASQVAATPAPAQLFLSGRASSPRRRRAPGNSPPSSLAGVHGPAAAWPGQRGAGINHAPAGSPAPLLSSWPLRGRTRGPRRSPRRLQSCSPWALGEGLAHSALGWEGGSACVWLGL